MKGAVAALAGAVLFFLGVLTGASDGDGLAPPPAIQLKAEPSAAPAGATGETGSGTPAAPPTGDPAPPAGTAPAPAPTGGGTPAPAPAPSGGESPDPPATGAGVEEVGGQVDCLDVGDGRGQGRGGCPPGQAKRPDAAKGE